MNEYLPLGIYYEPARGRYRVRLYKFSKVTHCTYHTSLKEAKAALAAALEHREGVIEPTPHGPLVTTLQNLLHILTRT